MFNVQLLSVVEKKKKQDHDMSFSWVGPSSIFELIYLHHLPSLPVLFLTQKLLKRGASSVS